MTIIRNANQNDANQVASLINIIFDEMDLNALKDVSKTGLLKFIAQVYKTKDFLFRKGKTVVAEKNDHIVGVMFGYPSEKEKDINEIFYDVSKQNSAFVKPYVADMETNQDEWYLDSIAVNPMYRGEGIGSQLLDSAPKMAVESQKGVVGLNVDLSNPMAEKLYERKGFRTTGFQTIGEHLYHHMQKVVVQNHPEYVLTK